jgi:hypothetical protein
VGRGGVVVIAALMASVDAGVDQALDQADKLARASDNASPLTILVVFVVGALLWDKVKG